MKLKKFIATTLTIITAAVCAVGVSGCKDEISLPPMSEDAPMVATSLEMDVYKTIAKDYDKHKDVYENFVDYYNGDFKQVCEENFYYLNITRVEPEEMRWFKIGGKTIIWICVEKGSESQTDLVKPTILQSFNIFDTHLGDSRDNGSIAPWSIRLKAYFLPVEEEQSLEELSLKFGKLDNKKNEDFFINIYLGEACIGTSYFDTNVSISYEWFEDFFTRHLVYGG